MKAIIVAAGEGKRMRPLTLVKPKPMIEILGKPLLHHIIDSLPEEITELVIVIGYKKEAITSYFGDQFEGRPVTYRVQEKQLGNAHALMLCRDLLSQGERFLFMFADDLHSPKAIKKLLSYELGTIVQEHPDPSRFGVFVINNKNRVISMEEKPRVPKSNLVATGVYILDTRIFEYTASLHESGEYYMTDQIDQMVREHTFVVERTDFWHPIGYPHDISSAENILRKQHGLAIELQTTPVIILAGGRGTRMPEDEKAKPKVLAEITGQPLLYWQIKEIHSQGFSNITLSLGYKADMIIAWLNANNYKDIKYVIEEKPLGTGGGLKRASLGITEPFLALNADDIANVNLSELIRHGADGKYCVVSGMEIDEVSPYGLMICDEHKKICAYEEKKENITQSGMVNIGHYYLLPHVFDATPDVFSIEKDIFPHLAKAGKLLLHQHTGYWLPTGTSNQLKRTRKYFKSSENE